MENKDHSVLYKKFLDGQCTVEELNLLFEYFETTDKNTLQALIREQFYQVENTSVVDPNEEAVLQRVLLEIKTRTHPSKKVSNLRSLIQLRAFYPIAAAAVILIALSTIIYFYVGNTLEIQSHTLSAEILPGGNKASLTMADGKPILLSEDKEGIVMADKISYSDGTEIKSSSDFETSDVNYAILSTPKGGQYHIVLSDGSRVWLNAASTIEYPVKFRDTERRVKLTGEAYFEVSNIKSKGIDGKGQMPFIVEAGGQEVKVLGTQFNINSYSDESVMKTTLLEGSVHVSIPHTQQSTILKPNQQSTVSLEKTHIEVATVDPSTAVAWKNGLFSFYKTDLHEIMRQVSRWYDVDVSYEGKVTTESFYGEIQRSYKLTEVLKVLELGGVQFKIEHKNGKNEILVMSN